MQTIMVHGSDGKVMAPFGHRSTFYTGKRIPVGITGICRDEDLPLSVRKALVGLHVSAIFTKEQLYEQTHLDMLEGLEDSSLLFYAEEVILALKDAGKEAEADQMKEVVPDVLDMLVLEPGVIRRV